MKVLTFLTCIDQSKGGPSRSVPIFVKGLSELGVDVTLMIIQSGDMNLHSLDGTNAKIHILPPNYSLSSINQFIKEGHFDIIHGQCIWEPLFHQVGHIAHINNIPFILTPRGTLEPWSLNQKKIKKKIALALYQRRDLDKCSCIYSTSDMEADHIRGLGFRNPISVIPNGIEIDGYPRRDISVEINKQILFLSRIHPKKGIEVLIEAWKSIINTYNGWSLKIVGNGNYEYIESIRKIIQEKGLSDSISVLDPVYGKAKIELYQSSSAFVLPSYSENFGMVIAEAMSCGLPVITTTNTPWEVLNDMNVGWCIPLSVGKLAETLSSAMSLSPESLFDMGQRASLMINDLFNYRSCALKNKQLYEWIINGGKAPSFVRLN